MTFTVKFTYSTFKQHLRVRSSKSWSSRGWVWHIENDQPCGCKHGKVSNQSSPATRYLTRQLFLIYTYINIYHHILYWKISRSPKWKLKVFKRSHSFCYNTGQLTHGISFSVWISSFGASTMTLQHTDPSRSLMDENTNQTNSTRITRIN